MFFWRKKAEGFEWHAYVRTTIKLRREQRRAKLEEIGRVAAGQAKAVGGAAVQGVSKVADTGWRATVSAWRSTFARPAVALPVALCGLMATVSGAYRWTTIAADSQAAIPLAMGVLVLLLLAPIALGHLRTTRASLFQPASWHENALPVSASVALALILGWFAWGRAGLGPSADPAQPAWLSSSDPASTVVEGKATVLSGEMIRLQGRLLHLSGIEAPDPQQTCTRQSKQSWRCGEIAFAALERLARAKPFKCTMQGGPDALGRTEANCTVEGRDVAGALVKDGHVFSTASYFGGYASLEASARKAGQGVWSGEADRPADFRAKAWAAAKATAPDGCPIKGRISSDKKSYLMPWAPGYASVTPKTAKGERWFCDEAEAQNAGFKAAEPSRRTTN